MRIFGAAGAFFAAVFFAVAPALAADLETGAGENRGGVSDAGKGADSGRDATLNADATPEGFAPSEIPVWVDAGDVPTAYELPKYEIRTDFRDYEGGGLLGKVYLGLFPRLFIGGAAAAPGFVSNQTVVMTRDDAQFLARFTLLEEDEAVPALAIGWDGPAYDDGEVRGLYLVMSKEYVLGSSFTQFHGGFNTAQVTSFQASQDLRASAAMTTAWRNWGAYTALDEIMNPSTGPRWSLGFEAYFAPVTLGLEFRDLDSARGVPVSRMVRLTWAGRYYSVLPLSFP